jgi:hypothetical protein
MHTFKPKVVGSIPTAPTKISTWNRRKQRRVPAEVPVDATDRLGGDISDRSDVHVLGRELFALESRRPARGESPNYRILVIRVPWSILDALRLVHQERKKKVEAMVMALLCAARISLVLL